MKRTSLFSIILCLIFAGMLSAKAYIPVTSLSGVCSSNTFRHGTNVLMNNITRKTISNLTTATENLRIVITNQTLNRGQTNAYTLGLIKFLTNLSLNKIFTNTYTLGIVKKASNNSRAQITIATNALDVKLGADDVFYTNASLGIVRGFTNAFAKGITNRVITRGQTNAYSLGLIKYCTNLSLNKLFTNTFSSGIVTHATNKSHLMFTNVMCVQFTNRLMLKGVDTLSNYVIYVSNHSVKIKNR